MGYLCLSLPIANADLCFHLLEVGMAWASGMTSMGAGDLALTVTPSGMNFMGAGILALTVPQLIHSLGPTTLLGIFA